MYTKMRCHVRKNTHALTYLLAGGLFVLFCLFTKTVWAEDFRDQQDRMRDEYYDQQDAQREMNRVRDHEELRQTQTNQTIRYQEQDTQMKKAAKKIQQRAHPYEPEIISHDRGLINNNTEHKGSNAAAESGKKQTGDMPKVNVDRLLEGN